MERLAIALHWDKYGFVLGGSVCCLLLVASFLGRNASRQTALAAPTRSKSQSASDVTLVYTTGLLGNLTHCACGGLNQGGIGRIATVIERLRSGCYDAGTGRQGDGAKRPGLFVVDAGGFLEPNFPYPSVQLNAVREFFELVQYDVVHADGQSPIVKAVRTSAQPAIRNPQSDMPSWICANVVDATTRQPVSTPFFEKTVGTLKLAVIGLTSQEAERPAKAPPSPYAPSTHFCEQQARQFKATLKGELQQSSPSLLTVLGDDKALFRSVVYDLLKQYPLPADRVKAGATRVASVLRSDQEAKAILAADRDKQVDGKNADARRSVIRSLVADIERFERLAKEWKEKAVSSERLAVSSERKRAVTDPIETMKSLLPQMHEKSDCIVVLSQCGLFTDRKIASTFPHLIVIGGVGATILKKPEQVGESWLLPTSAQGAEVCAVNVAVTSDQSPVTSNGKDSKPPTRPLSHSSVLVTSFHRHPVVPGVPEDVRILKVLDDYFAELAHQAQRTVRQMPAGRRFVGSQKCITCHAKDGKVWTATTHAHAMETLKTQAGMLNGHGQKFPVGRINECYLCHRLTPKEGFSQDSTLDTRPVVSKAESHSPLSEGVGCESCHGAGEMHAQDGKRPIPVARPTESSCLSCHTPTRSPKFEFASFWEKIKH